MNNNHLSPHDRFMRKMMTNPKVIKEFFEQNLPANIRAIINFDSIKPQKDSFIDDKLRMQISDLLFSAEFNKQHGYLYLLVEHTSSPSKLLAFRMLKYVIAVMQHHLDKVSKKQLPLVYPMIIHNGRQPFSHSTDVFDLFGADKELAKDILWQPYRLIDLSQIPDEVLKAQLWYGVTARIAKHIYEKDVLPFFKDIIKDLKTLEDQGGIEYIYTILSYLVETAEISNKEEFIDTIKTDLSTVDGEKIMTLAEQFRQEGIQVGRQEGMQAGRQEGMQAGRQEGMQAGRQEGKIEAVRAIAAKLLSQGTTIDTIASLTELSKEEIEKLKREIH